MDLAPDPQRAIRTIRWVNGLLITFLLLMLSPFLFSGVDTIRYQLFIAPKVAAFNSGKLVGLSLDDVERRYGDSTPNVSLRALSIGESGTSEEPRRGRHVDERLRHISFGTLAMGPCGGTLVMAQDGVTVLETRGWCD